MRSAIASYTEHRWAPVWVLLGAIIVTVNARKSKNFDRNICGGEVIELQQQANFTRNTPEYFFQDPISGLLNNGPGNITVTMVGCKEFCGGWTWYWDAIPRLMTWILPILLLLSNIELSPIDKKRFMTVIHALGDPIDSSWSLIHKIYIWHRLYTIGLKKSPMGGDDRGISFSACAVALVARWYRLCELLRLRTPNPDAGIEMEMEMTRDDRARIIATVLAGFEEISGAKIKSEDYYHMIARRLGKLGEPDEDPDKFKEWRRTARILADARTNEFPRTCLAIVVYILGLAAGFVPEIGGGNTSTPGGRIGSALFLSWLVPLVLLSNTIGGFTSRRTCLTIMRQFVWATTRPADNENPTFESSRQGDVGEVQDDITGLIDRSPWNDYFESLQWLGSIYTYRPWKVLYLDIDHRTHAHRKNVIMAVGGFFPVTISFAGAFVIIWYAVPIGWNCRHIWVVGVFVLWIISAICTSMTYTHYRTRLNGHSLWVRILIKDAVIGFLSVSMILLSTVGLFNNCWCWSDYMMRRQAANVPLNTKYIYEENAQAIYSIVVGTCISVQVLFYAGFMFWWRRGVKLVRWTEFRRRQEWRHEMHEDVEYTDENFLLFWYTQSELETEEGERQQRHRSYSLSHSSQV